MVLKSYKQQNIKKEHKTNRKPEKNNKVYDVTETQTNKQSTDLYSAVRNKQTTGKLLQVNCKSLCRQSFGQQSEWHAVKLASSYQNITVTVLICNAQEEMLLM